MSDQHIETAAEQTGTSLETATWVVSAWLDSVGMHPHTIEWLAGEAEAGGYKAITKQMRQWAEAIRAVQP